jgi:hypothetical protein
MSSARDGEQFMSLSRLCTLKQEPNVWEGQMIPITDFLN